MYVYIYIYIYICIYVCNAPSEMVAARDGRLAAEPKLSRLAEFDAVSTQEPKWTNRDNDNDNANHNDNNNSYYVYVYVCIYMCIYIYREREILCLHINYYTY